MPAIGDTLREARMRQKLDIADVEERTKIRAKYLRALEHEDFGLLPGSTFVKTFLRTYAEVLGLDPHALLEEYRASYEPRDEAEIARLGPPAATRERERRRIGGGGGPPRPGTVIAALAVALVVFLVVLGLLSGGSDKGKSGSASAPTRTERPARHKQRARPPAAPASSVTLKVEPVVPTYACVDTGAGTAVVYQGILQGPRTFKGKTLRVNLGKSSPKLTVNGRQLPVAPSPNPVGYQLTPTGSKPLPIGNRPCA